MDRFQEMRAFLAVVDAGSFAGGADRLSVSRAAVSRYIAELESRLETRLLNRTTRRLSLTAEGELFYARCTELVNGVLAAETEITARTGAASGVLRINAPVTFGILKLAPLWHRFREQYPNVRLDITLSDRVVDLVEEGYDVAIRVTRELADSTLISRKLASDRMFLCASPGYLARHGHPAHPSDLVNHAVIGYRYFASGDDWPFDGPQGRERVRVRPWMMTNNGDTCRTLALADHGIILQPGFIVGDDLDTGRLVPLLPEYPSLTLGIFALYPSRKYMAPKVQALLSFLREAFRAQNQAGGQ